MVNTLVAGVDEVGCGPLAGPVVAVAVILDPQIKIRGINDSKILSQKQREALFPIIQKQCLAWAVGRAEVCEIDAINILQARLLAMQRAVAGLTLEPSKVLVDGNCCPLLPYPAEAIIKGDRKIPVISAASILAKVIRDDEMVAYDHIYPLYGFAKHKGYGTHEHLDAITKYGITKIHRCSFQPIKNLLLTSRCNQSSAQ